MIILSGFLLVDMIAADLPRLPAPGELIFPPNGIATSAGGHPNNVATALVRLGHRPDDITVVGAIGKDAFGQYIEGALSSMGIKVKLQKNERPTGKTFALSQIGADRAFVSDPGANLSLSIDQVIKAIAEERPKIFYMAGGLLGEADSRLSDAFKEARKSAITAADIVKPYGRGYGFIKDALPYLDLFHVNVNEGAQITGKNSGLEGAEALVRAGVGLALVTDEKGVYAAWKGGSLRQEGFKVKVVDTTAAGDSFVAGFLEMVSKKGMPSSRDELEESLLFAQATAAVKCTGVNTTNISLEAVEALKKSELFRRFSHP